MQLLSRHPVKRSLVAACGFIHHNMNGGKSANALATLFDGTDDYVTIGEPSNLTLNLTNTEITIGAWIKSADATILTSIVSKSQPGVPNISILFGVNVDGSLYANYGGAVPANAGTIAGLITSSNGWHLAGYNVTNVSGTYTGQIWLDGVKVSIADVTATLGSNTAAGVPVIIGAAASAGTVRRFKGNVDEVTFWNTGFVAADWVALYNNGHPKNPRFHSKNANLIHHYRMGDGDTYPTITDRVGSNNGTMTSMTSAAVNFVTDHP